MLLSATRKTLDAQGHRVNNHPGSVALLSPLNDLLLVSASDCDVVWDLEAGVQVFRQEFSTERPALVWINSPFEPSERVILSTDGVEVWDWRVGQEKTARRHHSTYLDEDLGGCIRSAPSVFGGKEIALEVAQEDFGRAKTRTSTIVLLDASALAAGQDGALVPSGPVCRDVLQTIGAFGTRLLFFNKDLCICSVERLSRRVEGKKGFRVGLGLRYVKHFFIPSDWYSQGTGLKTRITGKGDILFARAEEVAIVKYGLTFGGDKHEVWDDD